VFSRISDYADRTLENLAPSDLMIAVTRRRLLEAVRAFTEDDVVPPLLENPGIISGARSGDIIAPEGQAWLDAYEQTLRQARHPKVLAAAE
jgi:phthalate 4,5-dioxygenase